MKNLTMTKSVVAWISFDQPRSDLTNFLLARLERLEPSLGARQKQPAGAGSFSSPGTLRPRSDSPHSPHLVKHSTSTLGQQLAAPGPRQGKVQQQSRSLDERRSRISLQRNSSFSSLTLTSEDSSVQAHYLGATPPSLQPGAPPTITVRRPSMTCGLQPGGAVLRPPVNHCNLDKSQL